jgi:hypothetical protein
MSPHRTPTRSIRYGLRASVQRRRPFALPSFRQRGHRVKMFNAPETMELAIMKASHDKRQMGASTGVCNWAGKPTIAVATNFVGSIKRNPFRRFTLAEEFTSTHDSTAGLVPFYRPDKTAGRIASRRRAETTQDSDFNYNYDVTCDDQRFLVVAK